MQGVYQTLPPCTDGARAPPLRQRGVATMVPQGYIWVYIWLWLPSAFQYEICLNDYVIGGLSLLEFPACKSTYFAIRRLPAGWVVGWQSVFVKVDGCVYVYAFTVLSCCSAGPEPSDQSWERGRSVSQDHICYNNIIITIYLLINYNNIILFINY